MGETANIAEVAQRISKDIFKHFRWHMHPKRDVNFECVNEEHLSSAGKPKKSHPTDAVFSYDDPYLGVRINLLSDLKSYAANTITHNKIRTALKSLAVSVECANVSEDWRTKFLVTSESNEVRGLLFVHNHDKKYRNLFYEELKKVHTNTLPIAQNTCLHYLGPQDIQRLYTIANDIIRLRNDDELSNSYTFYYPDLVLYRRQGDVWGQSATIESLCGPFLIIKDRHQGASGYVIYYNRPGSTVDEFVYLLDCFSRYQMIDSNESIRIRIVSQEADGDVKSRFLAASDRYARVWGFDPERTMILESIEIERVTAVSDNYDPGDLGWRV
jgi:hypothetical protein